MNLDKTFQLLKEKQTIMKTFLADSSNLFYIKSLFLFVWVFWRISYEHRVKKAKTGHFFHKVLEYLFLPTYKH